MVRDKMKRCPVTLPVSAARIDCAELARMGYLRRKLPAILPRAATCDKES